MSNPCSELDETQLADLRIAHRRTEITLRYLGTIQIVIATLGVLLALLVMGSIVLEIRSILQQAAKAGREGVTDFSRYRFQVGDQCAGFVMMSTIGALFFGFGWLGRGLRRRSSRSWKISTGLWFLVCLGGFSSPFLARLGGIRPHRFEDVTEVIIGLVSLVVFVFLVLPKTRYITSKEYHSVVNRTPQLEHIVE